jgi:cytochrome bd ubiquinol oxidase subunit II
MLHLHTLWFVIVVFFWTGFFVLEGFDFGVGALHTVVGRTDTERRVAINAIGPFWDGNEVWLVVAGAGTFAAFPTWYATMFSSLYLALVLVLVALMARGVSFEYRGKSSDHRWQRGWTMATVISSALIPLLIGIGLGDLLAGLPINSSHDYTGNFFDLFTPYGLWTGLTLLTLSLLHGATFLTFKTTGVVSARSRRAARPLAWSASAAVLGFVIWTAIIAGHRVPVPVEGMAVIAVIGTAWLAHSDQEGWAFAASAVAIAMTVVTLFAALSPNVMVSSTNAAYNLTISSSASGSYALKVMTVSAVIFLPLVLLYQGWSFHVFRGRVTGPPAQDAVPAPAPKATTAP